MKITAVYSAVPENHKEEIIQGFSEEWAKYLRPTQFNCKVINKFVHDFISHTHSALKVSETLSQMFIFLICLPANQKKFMLFNFV
jgi:hypothetical protein